MVRKKIYLVLLLINCFRADATQNFKDYFSKLIIFYLMDSSSTLAHEYGHAIVSKLYHGAPKIFMGTCSEDKKKEEIDKLVSEATKEVNYVTFNPNTGFTHPGGVKIRSNSKESS